MVERNATVLILAAGASSRFGGPKALAMWEGETLLSRAIRHAGAVEKARILVVLGGHAEALKPEIENVPTIFNAEWEQGIGTSIASGALAAIKTGPDILLILPVDQPLVISAHLDALIKAAATHQRCAFTRDGAVYGPPAAIPAPWFPVLLGLNGKQGLKAVIPPGDIVWVDGPVMLEDVDTPEDLKRLLRCDAIADGPF